MIARRTFLAGIASAFAAPAIVRIQNIMPVKAMPSDEEIRWFITSNPTNKPGWLRSVFWEIQYSLEEVPVRFCGLETLDLTK